MEDVIAVSVSDRKRGVYAFLTWGRVYDSVDPSPLIAAFRRVLPRFGFSAVNRIAVCYDLSEVQGYRYFYEGLLSFAVRMATEPYNSEDWQREQSTDEMLSRSVYMIGPPRTARADANAAFDSHRADREATIETAETGLRSMKEKPRPKTSAKKKAGKRVSADRL